MKLVNRRMRLSLAALFTLVNSTESDAFDVLEEKDKFGTTAFDVGDQFSDGCFSVQGTTQLTGRSAEGKSEHSSTVGLLWFEAKETSIWNKL